MTDRIGFEDAGLQRMEQATLWLQRMRTSGQDDRVVEAWLDWCQRDPLNQQAFDEIAAIWEISGQIPREPAAASRTGISRRALVASLAGLGVAGVAGGWWWRQTRETALTSQFASPVGVNSLQKLADGSVLELGGGTRVTVSIGEHERRVELHEGELFVTVHHDTTRPFLVRSGRLEAVATGTAFNVLRTEERTTVTVTEGTVNAFHEGRAAGANVRLKAGEQLIYSYAPHSVTVRTADPALAAGWRSGMLYFQNDPLSEVIATINRYTTQTIVVEDPRVRKYPFLGSADVADIDGWLEGLPDILTFPVGVREFADGRRLIFPQPDATD